MHSSVDRLDFDCDHEDERTLCKAVDHVLDDGADQWGEDAPRLNRGRSAPIAGAFTCRLYRASDRRQAQCTVPRKPDALVPPSLRAWESAELPLLRKKRGLTDDELAARRAAASRLCALLDELARPLAELVEARLVGRPHADALAGAAAQLDLAAELARDRAVAPFAALFTILAHRTLPGLIWRVSSRFEGFTLRPTQGDCVVKPWDVAKRACAGRETGSLVFFLLGRECDAAIDGYVGGARWTLETLEPFLRPRWPANLQ